MSELDGERAPAPAPDKTLAKQQEDLADDILGVLGLAPPRMRQPESVTLTEYESVRAAIAQYTVTVCMSHGAVS